MDKNINKNLEAIKNRIDEKGKDIVDYIAKLKQKMVGQVNKHWYTDSRVIMPLIITIIIAIFISCYFSEKTDEILEDIKEITEKINTTTTKTYDVITGNAGKTTEELEPLPPIKKKIIKTSIPPDGTITLWATLNKPDDIYQKGYIFDIGDSLVKNRTSLFVDENGFLVWKIYESNYNIHALKYDINKYLKGEKFFIALTWTKAGELIMYINGESINKIDLYKLDLNITSEDMYWGSDIEGNYVINFD